MSVTVNRDAARRAVLEEGARRLLRAAVYFQAYHQEKLSVSNPKPHTTPSLPGEYPRKRTGFGIASVVYGPATVPEIIDGGLKIRLGILQNAWYMIHLEVNVQRLGFQKTAALLEEPIRAILESKA